MFVYRSVRRAFCVAVQLRRKDIEFQYIIVFLYLNSKGRYIPTHTLSSPITSETVSKKFPGNLQKFPKKLEALLLVTQLGTGNFYRF